jgi:hypothetical protein
MQIFAVGTAPLTPALPVFVDKHKISLTLQNSVLNILGISPAVDASFHAKVKVTQIT